MSFLGNEYISYVVKSSVVVQPLRRRRRRRQVPGGGEDGYITAQNRISLSFTTDGDDGTLLQLGDPQGTSEYLLLQVRIRLRCLHNSLIAKTVLFRRGGGVPKFIIGSLSI